MCAGRPKKLRGLGGAGLIGMVPIHAPRPIPWAASNRFSMAAEASAARNGPGLGIAAHQDAQLRPGSILA